MDKTFLFLSADIAHDLRGADRAACAEDDFFGDSGAIPGTQTDRPLDFPRLALRFSDGSGGLLDAVSHGVEMNRLHPVRPEALSSKGGSANSCGGEGRTVHASTSSARTVVLIAIVTFISCFLLAARTAMACPMCADAIASQKDQAFVARLTQGFGWSIALLMCTPYLLFAGITFIIIRSARRARK